MYPRYLWNIFFNFSRLLQPVLHKSIYAYNLLHHSDSLMWAGLIRGMRYFLPCICWPVHHPCKSHWNLPLSLSVTLHSVHPEPWGPSAVRESNHLTVHSNSQHLLRRFLLQFYFTPSCFLQLSVSSTFCLCLLYSMSTHVPSSQLFCCLSLFFCVPLPVHLAQSAVPTVFSSVPALVSALWQKLTEEGSEEPQWKDILYSKLRAVLWLVSCAVIIQWCSWHESCLLWQKPLQCFIV